MKTGGRGTQTGGGAARKRKAWEWRSENRSIRLGEPAGGAGSGVEAEEVVEEKEARRRRVGH